MPESNTLPRTEAESKPDPESSTETEYVERTDVGVSLTVKLTRSIDTCDQDTIRAKMKATTLEEAREDMETLRAYVSDLAADVRQIQPAPPRKNVALPSTTFTLQTESSRRLVQRHQGTRGSPARLAPA